MYYDDGLLTEEELREYNRSKCLDLWNPYVIDNDPDLTDAQREQLKDYNRIRGD